MSRTRTALAVLPLAGALLLSACSSSAEIEADQQTKSSNAGATKALVVDTSPEQKGRVHTKEDAAAAELVPPSIAADGKLTIAVAGLGAPPLGFLASDNSTVVGSEVDIASLVADSLGLQLEVQNMSWEQWPLALQSGGVEAVFSNVGVNKARLELFDFATYRQGVMAFTTAPDSTLTFKEAKDIAGHTIAVASGTNQERILLDWNEQNEAAGLEPAQLQYFANDADVQLALQSGRIEGYLAPNPSAVYQESLGKVRIAGTVNAGWPNTTYVAATSLKGNGLVDAFEAALQHTFDDGSYRKTLERWGLSGEAVDKPEINPQVAS
ncbi:ABC transporter substrate-binding protein [Modestobacter sp. NPDC049651]|uniref:ABC transporter substrate-binding protein n=1 Tax=unclassified Modestobacter TaxID=2643866 RepID=UPI0033FE3062